MNVAPRTASRPPASVTAFARLRNRTWEPVAPSRATAPSPGATRRGSWPPHGAMRGAVAYALPAPDTTVAPPPAGGLRFSSPDTAPDAPNTGSHTRSHPCGLGNQVRALMPTPQAKLADAGPDYARATRAGSGGDDLTTLIARTLLPTPRARDGKGPDRNPNGVNLNQAIALLPTPRATDATKGSPHQHGSSGDLTLTSAIHLMPTPTAGDARSSAIQTVHDSGRPIPAGCVTLTDAARLLPTPSVADALGGHRSRSGSRSHELLLPGVARSLAAGASGRSGKVKR